MHSSNVCKRSSQVQRWLQSMAQTEGQVCTCLAAQAYLEPEAPLLISSIDYQIIYDEERLRAAMNDSSTDVLVFTFIQGGLTFASPEAFAYCCVEDGRGCRSR